MEISLKYFTNIMTEIFINPQACFAALQEEKDVKMMISFYTKPHDRSFDVWKMLFEKEIDLFPQQLPLLRSTRGFALTVKKILCSCMLSTKEKFFVIETLIQKYLTIKSKAEYHEAMQIAYEFWIDEPKFHTQEIASFFVLECMKWNDTNLQTTFICKFISILHSSLEVPWTTISANPTLSKSILNEMQFHDVIKQYETSKSFRSILSTYAHECSSHLKSFFHMTTFAEAHMKHILTECLEEKIGRDIAEHVLADFM